MDGRVEVSSAPSRDADERTHMDVRAGKRSMDGCSRLVFSVARRRAPTPERKVTRAVGRRGKDMDVRKEPHRWTMRT
jgi:hypothetical protein